MRCPSCNEQLLPGASLCRFCGLYLNQPEPVTLPATDDTQKLPPLISSPHYGNTPRLDIPVVTRISAIIFVLFVLYGLYSVATTGPQLEHNGDPLDLRGGNIITIRMPDSIALSQRVEIFEDGHAARIKVQPNMATSPFTDVLLSADEQQGLNIFREQWCNNQSRAIELETGSVYYDIAVVCDSAIKQAKVPIERFPSILNRILQRVPPLIHDR